MSGDVRRLDRVRGRAEDDVRLAHRAARALLDHVSVDAETWRGTAAAEPPAEILLHLALVAGRVVDGLRVAASGGAPRRQRCRTMTQATALKVLFATWRHPKGDVALPGTASEGTIESPEVLRRRHVSWAADYVQLLRSHGADYLAGVWVAHPRYGDLNPFEWARWMRIYFRSQELRCSSRE